MFNVGRSGENYRKLDLVEIIQRRAPSAAASRTSTATRTRATTRSSFDKIAGELGFETTMTVPDGIGEVIAALDAGAFDDPFAARYRNIP